MELSSQILWDVFEFCSVGAECTGGRRYGGINCQGEGGDETTERQVTDKRETGDTRHTREIKMRKLLPQQR